MILEKITYRMHQFWMAVTGSLSRDDWVEIQSFLTPEQLRLFNRMSEAEKVHSLRVFRRLRSEGYQNVELLTAALLHDVGKSRYPLSLWERVWVVVAPNIVKNNLSVDSQKHNKVERALLVAERHPLWGAEMAQAAGVSATTAWLIQHHERDDPQALDESPRGQLLAALIRADSLS